MQGSAGLFQLAYALICRSIGAIALCCFNLSVVFIALPRLRAVHMTHTSPGALRACCCAAAATRHCDLQVMDIAVGAVDMLLDWLQLTTATHKVLCLFHSCLPACSCHTKGVH